MHAVSLEESVECGTVLDVELRLTLVPVGRTTNFSLLESLSTALIARVKSSLLISTSFMPSGSITYARMC